MPALSAEDRAARLAHDVRGDGAQLDVGQLQRLLDPIDVMAPLADEGLAQAGQVAQVPHGAGRHEAPAQQPAFQQLSQPLTIPHIGLAARDHLHVPRVHQHQVQLALQHRIHRAPVHPGGFDGRVGDAVAPQPGGQVPQPAHRGDKGLRLRPALAGAGARHPHAPHHRRLVHVEARTLRIEHVHGRRPSGGSRAFSAEDFPNACSQHEGCGNTMGYLETPRDRFRVGLGEHQ
jgi:hypothetical protein